MTQETLSKFVHRRIRDLGFNNKTLAEKGGISFRIISDVLQGRLDATPIDKTGLSNRKINGLSGAVYRLLSALEEDPRPWMQKLGLDSQYAEVVVQQSFENRVALAMSRTLTQEDLEQYIRVQKELGEIFTLEMAIRIFFKKHNI